MKILLSVNSLINRDLFASNIIDTKEGRSGGIILVRDCNLSDVYNAVEQKVEISGILSVIDNKIEGVLKEYKISDLWFAYQLLNYYIC